MDLSNWQVTGGIEHTFAPGTVIPAGGTLYLSPDVNTFRARATSPTGGEGLFIQGAFNGHLSSFSETLNLLDSQGNLLTSTTYSGNPTHAQLFLVVSEVMYHPLGDGLAEFIELTNVSPSLTLDLTGVRFVEGIEFDFTGSATMAAKPSNSKTPSMEPFGNSATITPPPGPPKAKADTASSFALPISSRIPTSRKIGAPAPSPEEIPEPRTPSPSRPIPLAMTMEMASTTSSTTPSEMTSGNPPSQAPPAGRTTSSMASLKADSP